MRTRSLLMERRIGGLDVDFLLAHWASMLLRREDRNVCELIDGPRWMDVAAGLQLHFDGFAMRGLSGQDGESGGWSTIVR